MSSGSSSKLIGSFCGSFPDIPVIGRQGFGRCVFEPSIPSTNVCVTDLNSVVSRGGMLVGLKTSLWNLDDPDLNNADSKSGCLS
jgi:hypothetical protein